MIIFLQSVNIGEHVPWWLLIGLVASNIVAPYLTYLATRRQYQAGVDSTATQTTFLKLDKAVQLMDKIEAAQAKYLSLEEAHAQLRRAYADLEDECKDASDDFREFQKDVLAMISIVEMLEYQDSQFQEVLYRVERIRRNFKMKVLSGVPDKTQKETK